MTDHKTTPLSRLFDVDRLGLATFFLAVAYFILGMHATGKLRQVHRVLKAWTSQKFFHLFVVVHLYARTIAFTVMAGFSIAKKDTWFPMMVMLFTLPEILMLTVYVILYFHWLEVFIFSHDQFWTNRREFGRRWKVVFAVVTVILYSVLGLYYIFLCVDNANDADTDAKAVATIEQLAAIGDVTLPGVMGLSWLYFHLCALSGFGFKNTLARQRVEKINKVMWVWTSARLLRGAVFFVSIADEWETSMTSVILSMTVFSVLAVTELIPILYALDWSVVAMLLMGATGNDLLRRDASYAHLGSGGGGSSNGDATTPFTSRSNGYRSIGSNDDGGANGADAVVDFSLRFGSPVLSAISTGSVASNAAAGGEDAKLDLIRDNSPRSLHKWVIAPDEVQLQGSAPDEDDGFAFTQRAMWRKHIVQVHGYRFHFDETHELLNEMIKDMIACNSLQHEHIVPFLGITRVGTTVYSVSQFMPGHSLLSVLKRSSMPFFPATLLTMARQIALALEHVHRCSPHRVHGSLKSANVMLDASLHVKLSAIGSARLRNYAEIMLVKRTADAWCAPEVLRGDGVQPRSDVYSFGVVCWELLTRQVPFGDVRPSKLRSVVLKQQRQLVVPDDADAGPQFVALVRECLSFDARDRPSIRQVLERLDDIIALID